MLAFNENIMNRLTDVKQANGLEWDKYKGLPHRHLVGLQWNHICHSSYLISSFILYA
jgi:hypothetical protein